MERVAGARAAELEAQIDSLTVSLQVATEAARDDERARADAILDEQRAAAEASVAQHAAAARRAEAELADARARLQEAAGAAEGAESQLGAARQAAAAAEEEAVRLKASDRTLRHALDELRHEVARSQAEAARASTAAYEEEQAAGRAAAHHAQQRKELEGMIWRLEGELAAAKASRGAGADGPLPPRVPSSADSPRPSQGELLGSILSVNSASDSILSVNNASDSVALSAVQGVGGLGTAARDAEGGRRGAEVNDGDFFFDGAGHGGAEDGEGAGAGEGDGSVAALFELASANALLKAELALLQRSVAKPDAAVRPTGARPHPPPSISVVREREREREPGCPPRWCPRGAGSPSAPSRTPPCRCSDIRVMQLGRRWRRGRWGGRGGRGRRSVPLPTHTVSPPHAVYSTITGSINIGAPFIAPSPDL